MNELQAFLSDPNAILYVRGFIYLYVAVMVFLAALVYVNPDHKLWSWAYRARMLSLAAFFLTLSMGGISAYLGYPEFGRAAITYGATFTASIYAALITLFVIWRK